MAGSAVLQMAIALVSLSMASVAGFYIHPKLLPLLTVWLPSIYGAVRQYLTAPVLFVLLNMVVGALYASSGGRRRRPRRRTQTKMPLPDRSDDEDVGDDVAGGEFEEWVTDVAKPVRRRSLRRLNEQQEEELASLAADAGGDADFDGSVRTHSARAAPTAPEEPRPRLVRSKSEQIPQRKKVSLHKMNAKSAKKATAAAATATKPTAPLVPRHLPPPPPPPPPPAENDLTPQTAAETHADVDKQAEDFISRFYHQTKLQRLESLLRRQQRRP